MPIITTLVMRRFSPVDGQSPRRSRASINWPTISAGVRLRTSFCVPVWQKRQLSVQPTWDETHSVPLPGSGMNTVSNSMPGPVRNSHLRVPSLEICSVTSSGRSSVKCSAMSLRKSFARLVIEAKSLTPCA